MAEIANIMPNWKPSTHSLREQVDLMRSWKGFSSFDDAGDEYFKTERDYKDKASEEIRALFSAEGLRSDLASDNLDAIAKRFATYRAKNGFSNMPNWRTHDKVFRPIAQDPEARVRFPAIVSALIALQQPDHDTAEVADVLADGLGADNPDVAPRHMWSHVSYLAMMLRPDRYVFVKPSITDKFLKLVEIDWLRPKPFSGESFATFTAITHTIVKEMASLGLKPRDMIDLQSFMWISVNSPEEEAVSIPERLRLAVEALTPDRPEGVTEAEIREYLEAKYPRDEEEAPWADVDLMPGDWAIWAGYELPCNNSYKTGHFLKRVSGRQPFRYVSLDASAQAPSMEIEALAPRVDTAIAKVSEDLRQGDSQAQQTAARSVAFLADGALDQWAANSPIEEASGNFGGEGLHGYGTINVLHLPAGLPLRDVAIASFRRWAASTGYGPLIERAKRLTFPGVEQRMALHVPPPWAALPVSQISQGTTSGGATVASREQPPATYACPPFTEIVKRVTQGGLRLAPDTLRRYHLAARTRGFVILAGVSGSGKTWLAELYAEAVGAALLLVPVAPNWNTNEDLLGYSNPFTGLYQDTAASLFVRHAAQAFAAAEAAGVAPRPYHLVLDEMNLARVEHYFARFLSALEVRARHGHGQIELGPNDTVVLPPNLVFVGTVNVDETTHGFADKVYDRAHVIELAPDRNDIAAHLGDAPYREVLLDLWDALLPVAPFAYRVLDDIRAYVTAAADLGVPWQVALDEQLLHKVLPKVKGTNARLGTALEAFVAATNDHPTSQARARALLEGFNAHGFASFF